MEFCDKIATLCIEQYNKLGKSGKPIEKKEWTLLSGIVEERGERLTVVSLATGTKCIGANSMCPQGTVLNDSHAEVLARRAFLRYLYYQISISKAGNSSSVFKQVGPKFAVRDDVKWHMFTSQVPCGDASIIPMEELEDCSEPVKKRQKTDVHRTGAKPVSSDPRQDLKGPGPMYHTRGAVRIKPGRGDPTLSLSCSDKIARWIYVGIQGALLSNLIERSIRLSTIVISRGSQFDSDLIFDSLVKRSNLEEDFPKILQSKVDFVSSLEKVNGGKPAPASIIWCAVPDKPLEVAVDGKRLGATKRAPLKGILKVSKQGLLKEFLSLCPTSFTSLTYRQMKDSAVEYQTLLKKFKENMGSWSCKPTLENFVYINIE